VPEAVVQGILLVVVGVLAEQVVTRVIIMEALEEVQVPVPVAAVAAVDLVVLAEQVVLVD
jgi:hypothetical protein